MKKEPLIYLEDGRQYPLEYIDTAMSTKDVFYVGNPDYSVFKKAYEEITKYKYNYKKFIALYEWACKEIGIRKRNMIMWYGFFDELKKEATKFYERIAEEDRAKIKKRLRNLTRNWHLF